jgi:hypothetical protein
MISALIVIGAIVSIAGLAAVSGLVAQIGKDEGITSDGNLEESHLVLREGCRRLLEQPGDHLMLIDEISGSEIRLRFEPTRSRLTMSIHAPPHVRIVGPRALRELTTQKGA